MTFSKKLKTINNKIKKNKAQYDSDKETAKMLALSSQNVGKYEFSTSKYVLPEKDLLQKAARIKRFEYELLGSGLKSTLFLTFFWRYCKDVQTSYFEYFGHVWLCTPKMIISACRKIRCFSKITIFHCRLFPGTTNDKIVQRI